MKLLKVYQTSDGKTFESQESAELHANARYGKAVCALSLKFLAAGKYSTMLSEVESALPQMAELLALKADIELENPEDDKEA